MKMTVNPLDTSFFSESEIVLTRRELQTLLFSLHGETSKEIAEKLTLSPRTIDVYWSDIHKKFKDATGLCFLTKSKVIEFFLDHTDECISNSSYSGLVKELRRYRDNLLIIREKAFRDF